MMFSLGKGRKFTYFPMIYEENTYSQYEQELWDKAALSALKECVGAYESISEMTRVSCNIADAFMAERAKRMKERE